MIKQLFLAGLLTVGASAIYAQQATTPPRAADPQAAAMPSGADAKKLIGRNVKNPQDETVGEIELVYINADGKVDSVIVGAQGLPGHRRAPGARALEGSADQQSSRPTCFTSIARPL